MDGKYIELRFTQGGEDLDITQNEVIRADDIIAFFIGLPYRTELYIRYKCCGKERQVIERFKDCADCYRRYLFLMDILEVKRIEGMNYKSHIHDTDEWCCDEKFEEAKKYVTDILIRYRDVNWEDAKALSFNDTMEQLEKAKKELEITKLRAKDFNIEEEGENNDGDKSKTDNKSGQGD